MWWFEAMSLNWKGYKRPFSIADTTTFLVRKCNNSYRVVKHQVWACVQRKYEDCVIILHFSFQSYHTFYHNFYVDLIKKSFTFFEVDVSL